jgi:predicted amidophosphoribosyltransferase
VSGDALGLRLLLVDDVRTTGNTARECARVLRETGAASVSLLTAAVASHHGKLEEEPLLP